MSSSWSISHDFFFQLGGAERVSTHLASAVGTDDVFAIAGDPAVEAQLGLRGTRHVGGRGYTARNYRMRSLARPVLDLARRPVPGNVISSSYAFAHHVRAEGTHLVYCHSPLRQIWSGSAMYGGRALAAVAPTLRALDRAAARRADGYIATNQVVAGRIRRFYGVEPLAIVPPPVDEAFTREGLPAVERRAEIVWAGRIVEPYKQLGLLLDAMRDLPDIALVVAGDGRDRARLEATAPANVRFLGAVDTTALADLYARAALVVFPSEDDFGMVPIEAMTSGAPIVAYRGGGAVETVTDGYSGVFFDEHTPESLRTAIRRALRLRWDHEAISADAARWSADAFAHRVRTVAAELVS
ncbi:glycosyltransferase [Curtobacterium sp. PhB115]|uniref:glycosyltransferase n=1 Tax=Curtobacterium sp. PhB115 TaxID=2485173 RepID=UPI000F4BD1AD|nr:glycosyltransferase [Curtobacterium sp. PhB115]ROP74844.1 glycosyltransferase involved in cell wall biosynthesis [Curtobacterium sp. PhB115]